MRQPFGLNALWTVFCPLSTGSGDGPPLEGGGGVPAPPFSFGEAIWPAPTEKSAVTSGWTLPSEAKVAAPLAEAPRPLATDPSPEMKANCSL